jgi:ATP-binding cassette subfamily B protein
MMLIYASASLVTGIFAAFFGTSFSLHNAMVIRNKMYNHICNFSFNEIDKFSTPSLVTRLSNDVQKYQSNLQLIITLAFRAPVTMVISAINAFTPPLGSTLYGFCCLGMVIAMLTIITLIA